MPPPTVVWAMQAPTLLNLLVKSSKWHMLVADLGDAASIREMDQLEVPHATCGKASLVFCCTPSHVKNARLAFPSAKTVLVAHQGYKQKLPSAAAGTPVVTFTHWAAHNLGSSLNPFVITPHFPVRRGWSWSGDNVWTMMSRPRTREAISTAALMSACALSRYRVALYGQDQADGFLTTAGKEELLRSSSGYASAHPARAGLGLAEYEAMSRGCPVAGVRWGDIQWVHHLGGVLNFDNAFTDYGDIYGIAGLFNRLAEDRDFAEATGASQASFVEKRYCLEAMNDSIESLLDVLLGAK